MVAFTNYHEPPDFAIEAFASKFGMGWNCQIACVPSQLRPKNSEYDANLEVLPTWSPHKKV
jgi:hypothetical protein